MSTIAEPGNWSPGITFEQGEMCASDNWLVGILITKSYRTQHMTK